MFGGSSDRKEKVMVSSTHSHLTPLLFLKVFQKLEVIFQAHCQNVSQALIWLAALPFPSVPTPDPSRLPWL